MCKRRSQERQKGREKIMAIGDDEREENAKTYYFRAKKKIIGTVSGTDKQFYADGLKDVWNSFDALLGLRFADKKLYRMRKKLNNKYNSIIKTENLSDSAKDSIRRLRAFGELRDMSPIKPGPKIRINDINNLLEILNFSYRVRSNLNHGSKDVQSDNKKAQINRSLVEFSFKSTFEILEQTLIHERLISV